MPKDRHISIIPHPLIPIFLAGFLACVTLSAFGPASTDKSDPQQSPDSARRIEVLFLGSENRFDHDPPARFRVIRKALGSKGINFTYAHTTSALTPENLARYDVLLIFANHNTIEKKTEGRALIDFARKGGGCVLLHCAAGCFRESEFDEYVDLLGAQFKGHGTGVFRAKIVDPEHPIMKGWEGFECWDETYEHKRQSEDRVILQKRDEEPWTWVKDYGKGRVFYTASGHDHRCWDLPEYHDLIHRAVRWTAGDNREDILQVSDLPVLHYRKAKVPKDPDNPEGPINEIQQPLPPKDSMKLAQVPPGFELKLFASEPDVINPIAINWDHRGRLWVVEAYDYPHKIGTEKPQDRIKILEDTDEDGVADKVTIFAEGLNICTSVLPTDDGALATDGRNLIRLRDTDSDDRADRKEILWTGIGLRDTHACTSNLRYGFDGWIYATVGYSGLEGKRGGATFKSSQGVFRFELEGDGFEVLQNTSNNTWGLSFTEQGDLVGSTANGNPSWYLTIPNRHFEAVGRKPQQVARADGGELLAPITFDYFQNSPKEVHSSGAGHAIYTARRFPEGWWNSRALVCEPPLHLISSPRFTNDGDKFSAAGFEHNLYASADAWSAPVAAEVGPDGAVWIADWYNPICNHNPYRGHQKRGEGNAFITDDRDRNHGRIYRIYPAGSRNDPYPELTSEEECLEALAHPNLFWRLQAQRRLAMKADRGRLLEVANESQDPVARFHLLLALGSGKLDPVEVAGLARSLDSAQPDKIPSGRSPEHSLKGVADTNLHPLTRKASALDLAELTPDPNIGASLASALLTDDSVQEHRQLADSVRLAILKHPEGFVRYMLDNKIDPALPAVGRVVNDLITRFKDDRRILSEGLLQVAKNGDGPFARRLSSEAGAKPAKEPPAALSESARRGAETYLACVACHQPEGQGLENAFPPLAGSERLTGPPALPIKVVLKGLQGKLEVSGKTYNGVMPGHESFLSDQEIADVLSYARNSWGNRADDIKAATVRKYREELKDRTDPWTLDELK